MPKRKVDLMNDQVVSSGVPDTVSSGVPEVFSSGVKSGHDWTLSWPGCSCTRCGAEQVLELAVGNSWLNFGPKEDGSPGPEEWKSDDHKELVHLCDGFCYADMTPDEIVAHRTKIKALCEKIGWPTGKPKEPGVESVASVE